MVDNDTRIAIAVLLMQPEAFTESDARNELEAAGVGHISVISLMMAGYIRSGEPTKGPESNSAVTWYYLTYQVTQKGKDLLT